MITKTWKILGASALALALGAGVGVAEELELRISSENNANHVNTEFLQEFADRVNAAGEDLVHVELFHSGQLYKGRDVPRALRQGSVEMAAVGTWQLGGVAPNVDLLFIPHFYGRASSEIDAVVDGEIGEELNSDIEASLESTVLGRWISFGAAHLFGAGSDFASFDDLQGTKIRIAGGAANTARLTALEAVPTVLPWPDTPMALQQGTVDGLLTTYETAASGKLWEAGVTSAFEDNQYFGYFVPIVSNAFWDKASTEVRTLLTDTWESMVDEGRRASDEAQAAARDTLAANGVTITVPPAEELAAKRASMVASEAQLVNDLGASPELYARIKAALP